ncbi:MAG: hypothetical protein HFI65_05310 [Lachnospiraceae bacterium]|nr:hypothetical protein [Lachnospiraceae bacterium]
MKQKWDPGGYRDIIGILRQADDLYGQMFMRFGDPGVQDVIRACDKSGRMEEVKQRTITNKKRLMALVREMEAHERELDRIRLKGQEELSDVSAGGFGDFDLILAGGAVSYEGYKTWQYSQSGKTFGEDYNDAWGFVFQSGVFREANIKAGLGEVSNLELYIPTVAEAFNQSFAFGLLDTSFLRDTIYDDYTDELLENALAGILEGLPGIEPKVSIDGLSDRLENLTGIDNIDKWMKGLSSIIKKCAENGMTAEDILKSADLQLAIQCLSDDEREVFYTMFRRTYKANKLAGQLGDVAGAIGNVDTLVELLVHCLNDYSGQVAYLDTMEDALLAAGFTRGPVVGKIAEMKKLYQSDVLKSLDTLGDFVWDEASGFAKKKLVEKAASAIPLVREVDFGLKILDTSADILFADKAAAVKGLNGLIQYDAALTRTYERYVALMEAGIASEADMKEADKLYDILLSTKTKEYEHMMNLCEGKDEKLYQIYARKHGELTGKVGSSGGFRSGGGGRHG